MFRKMVIFFIIFGNIIFIHHRAQAEQWQETILQCPKITDDVKRLACFDAVIFKQNTPIIKTKEEKIAEFGKSQLRSSPVKKIRVEQKKKEQAELNIIKLKVVKSAYTASKKFVLFMANGQVWKQKDSGKVRLPKGEFEVVIKKGMIGGYNMTLPKIKSFVRVKRLK